MVMFNVFMNDLRVIYEVITSTDDGKLEETQPCGATNNINFVK